MLPHSWGKTAAGETCGCFLLLFRGFTHVNLNLMLYCQGGMTSMMPFFTISQMWNGRGAQSCSRSANETCA